MLQIDNYNLLIRLQHTTLRNATLKYNIKSQSTTVTGALAFDIVFVISKWEYYTAR